MVPGRNFLYIFIPVCNVQREGIQENLPEFIVVPDGMRDGLTILRAGVNVSQDIPASSRSPEVDEVLLRKYRGRIAGAVVVDRQKIHRILGHGVKLEDVLYISPGSGA